MVFDDLAHSADDHDHCPPGQGEETPHLTTMSDIGRKGGRTVREKYGPDFYAAIGKKGGEP